ncbi:hypothetical protein KIPB_010671, partial [Kipferlia bialata]|eukprot:g10671.t1
MSMQDPLPPPLSRLPLLRLPPPSRFPTLLTAVARSAGGTPAHLSPTVTLPPSMWRLLPSLSPTISSPVQFPPAEVIPPRDKTGASGRASAERWGTADLSRLYGLKAKCQ